MSGVGTLIGLMRDPTPAEQSRWYKPRTLSAATRMTRLREFFAGDTEARQQKRADGWIDILIDTGNSTTLKLCMLETTLEARVGPYVLTGSKLPPDVKQYAFDVSPILEVLQVGSGFYVFSDDLVGFDPCGECPECKVEVFEWQETCEGCEKKLYKRRSGDDEYDGRARRAVSTLLRRKMIELVSSRGKGQVEKAVASFYAYGHESAEILLGVLIDMPGVAEVYCDEEELLRALSRIK